MNAEAFWDVIGEFNQGSLPIQIVLVTAIICSIILTCLKKAVWLPKLILGISNLFIGIVFFCVYGTEPIQTYFAAPLFLSIGLLFLWETIKYPKSQFQVFDKLQWLLLGLVMLYPVASLLLGHSFPKLVVYMMPCPIISLSIVVYSCYAHKNKALLLLMTIWGLTGVKSFFFNVFEDVILLSCGIYCLYILIKEFMRTKKHNHI